MDLLVYVRGYNDRVVEPLSHRIDYALLLPS